MTTPTPDLADLVEVLRQAREALEPFGDVIAEYDPVDEHDETPATLVCGSVTDYSLCLGDLRRARQMLDLIDSALERVN